MELFGWLRASPGIPSDLDDKTISMCNEHDLVCDFGRRSTWNLHHYSSDQSRSVGKSLADKVMLDLPEF